MKQLKFICSQPDDKYYLWQVHLWLESLRNIGHSDKAIVLIFTPNFRPKNNVWDRIVNLYPEAEFHFYTDEENMSKFLGVYIPILRPYSLMRYFQDFPERKNDAIMYCDSDVVFTENFNIDEFINDDVNYVSDTNSYINASYFDSKVKDVLPEKLEEYNKRDILNETASLVGINREICEQHNSHSGGAQYLLKNIDHTFWQDVFAACINIRTHLLSVNKEFFESENKGFQSWCADMWAILFCLWKREQETKIIPEMNFSWSSDPIEKLPSTGILHNAGITDSFMGGTYPAFYKGSYHTGNDPLKDPHIYVALENEETKKRCNHYYLQQLIKLKEKYNISYE